MKAFVIGQPVSHSLSPSIFRVISEVEASSVVYSKMEVRAEDLSQCLIHFKNDDTFIGANVTLPHKETILNLADEVSDEAKWIGAANVISARPKGLKAFNTDVIGIRKTLESHHFDPGGKTILLLGAGGATRALAYVLGEKRAKHVMIYNPRSARGENLCQSFKKQFSATKFHSIRNLNEIPSGSRFDFVANGTPIGMKGEKSDFFDGLKNLSYSPSALAFDMLYTPRDLLFLRVMKEKGLRTTDGLQMLIEQALATWEIWIGKLNHASELRERLNYTLRAILRFREDPTPIFLTGFMGVGKSTVARELSYLLGRNAIDTDKAIEDKAHATVAEIFERSGEAKFRELEKEAILHLSLSQQNVVALGGGALNDPANLNHVLGHGTLIYLKASEQTLFKRLRKKAHDRPLLANLEEDALQNKIAELLAKRAPIYERAHLKIEIKPDDTPHDSAQRILVALGGGK